MKKQTNGGHAGIRPESDELINSAKLNPNQNEMKRDDAGQTRWAVETEVVVVEEEMNRQKTTSREFGNLSLLGATFPASRALVLVYAFFSAAGLLYACLLYSIGLVSSFSLRIIPSLRFLSSFFALFLAAS